MENNIKIIYDIFKLDEALADHSERVAIMASQFFLDKDIPKKYIEDVYNAALLHDIAKFPGVIPDSIEGKYLKDFDRFYPAVSYETAKMLGFTDEEMLNLVLIHNDNYNGSGTLYGLKAEQINILAMIIHICDYYDTCRMKGISHTAVTEDIRKQSMIMFPKTIITPFIKMIIDDPDLQFKYNGEGIDIE